jgi:hypothetical protein
VVVADEAAGAGGSQQMDARCLAKVVEAVVLAAECDLLLDSRDRDLVAEINDLDRGWQQLAAQLLARPACGWGGLRDRCRVSSARTARVHPARPA